MVIQFKSLNSNPVKLCSMVVPRIEEPGARNVEIQTLSSPQKVACQCTLVSVAYLSTNRVVAVTAHHVVMSYNSAVATAIATQHGKIQR